MQRQIFARDTRYTQIPVLHSKLRTAAWRFHTNNSNHCSLYRKSSRFVPDNSEKSHLYCLKEFSPGPLGLTEADAAIITSCTMQCNAGVSAARPIHPVSQINQPLRCPAYNSLKWAPAVQQTAAFACFDVEHLRQHTNDLYDIAVVAVTSAYNKLLAALHSHPSISRVFRPVRLHLEVLH